MLARVRNLQAIIGLVLLSSSINSVSGSEAAYPKVCSGWSLEQPTTQRPSSKAPSTNGCPWPVDDMAEDDLFVETSAGGISGHAQFACPL